MPKVCEPKMNGISEAHDLKEIIPDDLLEILILHEMNL